MRVINDEIYLATKDVSQKVIICSKYSTPYGEVVCSRGEEMR